MTYRIRVDLDDSEPPIWRRLDLASNLTLDALHDVLQTAMGWTDSHLHELLVEVGDRLFYLYDFGDDWAHTLTVESFAPRDPADGPAVCLAGAGACY